MGFHFSGLFAWWLWRGIYLAKLPRLEKKVRVALRWSLELLFSKDIAQYVTLEGLDRLERRIEYLRHHPMVSAQAAQTRPPELDRVSRPQSGVSQYEPRRALPRTGQGPKLKSSILYLPLLLLLILVDAGLKRLGGL